MTVCSSCHVGVYTFLQGLYCGQDTGLRYVIHFSLPLRLPCGFRSLPYKPKGIDICFYHQNEHSSSTTHFSHHQEEPQQQTGQYTEVEASLSQLKRYSYVGF
jgi:hypothetical protein